MTITPYFGSSITGAANSAQVEAAINTAIGTIDGLYSNSGSVAIVFNQANGNFLGESQTAVSALSYSQYTGALRAASAQQPTNTVLGTAIANLSSGNDANGSGNVLVTTANLKLALGFSGVTGCFNTSGSFVSGCGQSYFGVVTLTSNTGLGLNYGTTAVAGQYSMVNTVEHEINEILGGGGQGSVLNDIQQGDTALSGDYGVLDLYRYSGAGTPSFTTSSSAAAYFSVDGGRTNIIGFNQDSSGDYGDFSGCVTIQAAFTCSGNYLHYTSTSPETIMMNSLGYATATPEPASAVLLASGVMGLAGALRRRRH